MTKISCAMQLAQAEATNAAMTLENEALAEENLAKDEEIEQLTGETVHLRKSLAQVYPFYLLVQQCTLEITFVTESGHGLQAILNKGGRVGSKNNVLILKLPRTSNLPLNKCLLCA